MKSRLLRRKYDQREEKFESLSTENRRKQQYTVFEHRHNLRTKAQQFDVQECEEGSVLSKGKR